MDQTSEQRALTRDDAFHLLSNHRRRFVLYYLNERVDAVSIRELADEVAAWEYDRPVAELTDQQRKRTYVSLYQTHVPKMADVGIIEFDREEGQIELAPTSAEIHEFLPQSGPSRPWHAYYLVLAAVAVATQVAVWVDVASLGPVRQGAVSAVSLLAFGLLAVAHYYQEQYGWSPDYAALIERNGS